MYFPRVFWASVFFLATLAAVFLGVPATRAQGPGMPPSPVRYTEARQHAVREAVLLPGTVESPTVSIVASEVAGAVVELTAREGDAVEKGQPLARLRTATLELDRQSKQAQLGEAEARLKQAESHLERARELLESKVIARDQFDDRFFEVTAWKSRVEQLTADIARINEDIERSTVRAPFAGVVTTERTEAGQWLAVGAPVVELFSVADLEVRVDVPERYYRSIRRGTEAVVTFESLPGVRLAGRIRTIIPSADPQARTFPVKVSIASRNSYVGVGMLAEVSFPIGESYDATIVPKDAIVRRGPQQFVYLMNGEGTASLVPVETGQAAGSWLEVKGPVQPGQKVVTRGNERLQPGQPVQGEPQEYPLP